MSAALAYYTVFAMAPLLIMLIFLASLFYGEDAINRKLFQEIKKLCKMVVGSYYGSE